MPTYLTGNDADGIVLTADGDMWINEVGTAVTNRGVAFDFADTDDNTLTVAGRISANTGLGISVGFDGVGDSVVIERGGKVSGTYAAVLILGNDATFRNAGEVDSDGQNTTGVIIQGENDVLSNSGTISGQYLGLSVFGKFSLLENSGTITGHRGVQCFVDHAKIENDGSIIGTNHDSFRTSGASYFINRGLLSSIDHAYFSNGGVDRFLNYGTVIGDVYLGNKADYFRAHGDAVTDGLVNGGRGDDTLIGGDNAEHLLGAAGNNELKGGGGDDTLSGGYGNDILRGGAGDDQLFSSIFDTTMSGGSGSDSFVVDSLKGHDIITDFEDNADVLDLSGFGFSKVKQALNYATDTADGVQFDFPNNQSLEVLGSTIAQLSDDIVV